MKLAALIALLTLCGCTTRELYYEGVIYRHRSFGTRQSIGELSVITSNATVRVRGFNSDQVELLGTIAREAAAGAVKGVTP